MDSLSTLEGRWRERAATLEAYVPAAAVAFGSCILDLQTALASGGELLTLTEAANDCGYSADHLSRLVRRGAITNHGKAGRPLVRRQDLPRKAPGAHLADARRAAADVVALHLERDTA